MSNTAVRRHSYAGDILASVTALIVLLAIAVWMHNSTTAAQGSSYKSAQMLCTEKRAPEGGLMLGPSAVVGELPNVGAPSEIIVAPTCHKYTTVQPTFFRPEVTVYLVMSDKQLATLKGFGVSDTLPFGVEDKALNHLVTADQRRAIESGSKPNTVEYVLTTPDMNAPRVQSSVNLSSFGQQTLPRDLLSGTYYTREPIPSVREAYTSGPVIVVGGGK